MSVHSLRCCFSRGTLVAVPEVQGVVLLWDQAELVYVGCSSLPEVLPQTIGDLLVLLDRSLIRASDFAWEATARPEMRQWEAISLYVGRYGRIPRYNRKGSCLPWSGSLNGA